MSVPVTSDGSDRSARDLTLTRGARQSSRRSHRLRLGLALKSLRARLLVSLLSLLLLASVFGGWFVYRNEAEEADAFFDVQLYQMAQLLREQPVENIAPPALPAELNRALDSYDFVIQIWTLDMSRTFSSGRHTSLPAMAAAHGFSTVSTNEGRWRLFTVHTPARVVQVAQPMQVREIPAEQLALRALKPFILMVPLAGILIWLTVQLALKPLRALTAQLKTRRVDDIEPLSDQTLPEEVRPLVGALNELLGRLDAAREHERAFVADAAHELRTPLTALHLQLGTLARAGNEAERQDAMQRLAAGVQRAIRLVEQLLALARQEPRVSMQRTPVRLDAVAREVASELIPLADAKHIDLGVSRADECEILGDDDGLHTLLRNLVDNAVRYSGAGGRVDIGVELAPDGRTVLKVSDNGPGIAAEERDRVFDRFYRRPGMQAPGSGLGMAIVKAIADAHGAEIQLAANPGAAPHQGLAVSVSFPPASLLKKAATTGK